MVSDREQTTPDPILNPMGFLQDYLINYIGAITGFCENAIKASEYCVKAFWEPWLRAAVLDRMPVNHRYDYAIEFRHSSCGTERPWKMLKHYNIAAVMTDSPPSENLQYLSDVTVTAAHSFIRFHGGIQKAIIGIIISSEQELKPFVEKVGLYNFVSIQCYIFKYQKTVKTTLQNHKFSKFLLAECMLISLIGYIITSITIQVHLVAGEVKSDRSNGITSLNIYQNSTLGIKIQYPSNWNNSTTQDTVNFALPPENKSGKWTGSVGIGLNRDAYNIDLTNSSLSLNERANNYTKHSNSSDLDFQLISSRPITIAGGIPAIMVQTLETEPENTPYGQNHGTYKQLSIFTMKDNNKYFIWYQAKPAYFDFYLQPVLEMLGSLRFIEVVKVGQFVPTINTNGSAGTDLSPEKNTLATSGFTTYENSTLGIKIQYPSNWENQTKSENASHYTVTFVSPSLLYPENTAHRIRDTLTIDCRNPPANIPLNERANAFIKIFNSSRLDFQLISSQYIAMGGETPAVKLHFTYTDLKAGNLEQLSIVPTNVNRMCLIEYSAKPATFYLYLPVINKMIDSLKLS